MTEERQVLLRVRHGSHLYGTARPDSDEDWYEVVTGKPHGGSGTKRYNYSRQSVRGAQDVVRKDLGTWMREAQGGIPQAVEAAWAPDDSVEVDLIRPLRLGLTVGSAGWARHRRAMRNFACGYWDGGHAGSAEFAMKRARHAVRLSINLRKLRLDGRYTPRLTPAEWEECRQVAENLRWGEELWQTVDWRWSS